LLLITHKLLFICCYRPNCY